MATYLVISSDMQQAIRSVPGYRVDLGKNIMDAESAVFYDPIVKAHYAEHGRLVHQVGVISKLRFFVDNMFKPGTVMICSKGENYVETVDRPKWAKEAVAEIDMFLARAKSAVEPVTAKEETETKTDAPSVSDEEARRQALMKAAASRREEMGI